jgi:hypothetical protein
MVVVNGMAVRTKSSNVETFVTPEYAPVAVSMEERLQQRLTGVSNRRGAGAPHDRTS